MSSHVDFVGVLFVVWGVLTVLIGLSTLALGVGAAAIISSTSPASPHFAAGLTAAVFIVFAVISIVWGVAHAVVGVPVRRHRPWARLVALMLASVDLLLLPYGTALGIYALWALLREDSRKLFVSAE
ncbi:MAG: hypothetical protein ACM3SQ_14990 [Betaproteobacteria bacterium]